MVGSVKGNCTTESNNGMQAVAKSCCACAEHEGDARWRAFPSCSHAQDVPHSCCGRAVKSHSGLMRGH
jgi:hypothetical protein